MHVCVQIDELENELDEQSILQASVSSVSYIYISVPYSFKSFCVNDLFDRLPLNYDTSFQQMVAMETTGEHHFLSLQN